MERKNCWLVMAAMLAAASLAGCAEAPREAGADAAGNSTSAVVQPSAPDATAPTTPLPDPVATDEPVTPVGTLAPVTTFTARGNEPFWLVRVDGSALTYSKPELQSGKVLQAQRIDDAVGVVFTGNEAGQAYTLRIRERACQDSMSSESFEFTATFQHGEQSMDGCARRGL